MDKFDRFQQLHRLFKSHRRPIPLAKIARELECSEKTVKRIIGAMRDYYHAPIEYFPEARGWQYARDPGELVELPGLWLTGQELQSLSWLLHVLEDLGSGLLNRELAVIEQEIDKLLKVRGISPGAFAERVKVLPLGSRQVPGKTFHRVSEALLHRRQLDIRYSSYQNKLTERCVSPQTLVYYRENWYLDAWCHLRQGLRTFSLARITYLEVLPDKAIAIPKSELREYFAQSYGIFAGKPKHVAKLRFFSNIAREIAMQQWHPEQLGEWDGGEYLLCLPYSDERELVGDILRHGPNVTVEGPASLRRTICERLRESIKQYR